MPRFVLTNVVSSLAGPGTASAGQGHLGLQARGQQPNERQKSGGRRGRPASASILDSETEEEKTHSNVSSVVVVVSNFPKISVASAQRAAAAEANVISDLGQGWQKLRF